MNPDLQAKLAAIRTELNRTIELDGKRTTGEWQVTDGTVWDENGCAVVSDYSADTSAFIAHASQFSAVTAKALLRALDGLEREATLGIHLTMSCAYGRLLHEDCHKCVAVAALQAICELWPKLEAA
jgi:hypothetical protein